jgi:hypothetical protein
VQSLKAIWNQIRDQDRQDWSAIMAALRSQAFPTIIAAASAIASAVAAFFSYTVSVEQTRLAAVVPIAQTLYQSKLQSLADFHRVATRFDFEMNTGTNDLRWPVDTPAKLAKLNDQQMQALAESAHPMIAKYNDFIADAEGYAALWGAGVKERLPAMFQAVTRDMECFEFLGRHTRMYHESWQRFKKAAAGACQRLFDKNKPRELLSYERAVEERMRAEADAAADPNQPRIKLTEGYYRTWK